MNIWLIHPSEPLPTDGAQVRLVRVGQLAAHLASVGHNVTWWSSTFYHDVKSRRSESEQTIRMGENYRIKLLHSKMGYKTNVSIQRIVNHTWLAYRFAVRSRKEPKPDLIFCGFPTIELSFEAVRYGKEKGVPVILDVRDLWPECFLDLFPASVRGIGRLVLEPLFLQTRSAFRNAYAISGITQNYVKWGAAQGGRDVTELDRHFPFVYPSEPPSQEELKPADEFWDKLGVRSDDGWFNICYLGVLSRLADFDAVVDAGLRLDREGRKIRLVFCGSGDRLEELKKRASGSKNLIFTGWISWAQIWALMRRCSLGIAPYKKVENYQNNITNKIVEYFSAGLPALTSAGGVLRDLIEANGCGFLYQDGDSDGLVSLLNELAADPGRLKKAGRNALKVYERDFKAKNVHADMTSYFEEVVDHFKRDNRNADE